MRVVNIHQIKHMTFSILVSSVSMFPNSDNTIFLWGTVSLVLKVQEMYGRWAIKLYSYDTVWL